jgi:hypothetical protein
MDRVRATLQAIRGNQTYRFVPRASSRGDVVCAPTMGERLYSFGALVSPYPLPHESVERRNCAPHRMPRTRKQNHSLP